MVKKTKKKPLKKPKKPVKKKAVSKKKPFKSKKKTIKKKLSKPVKLPSLVDACKLWDKITTIAYEGSKYPVPPSINRFRNPVTGRNPIYSSTDYAALQCITIGKDTAEVTVGSSSGHTTHIDLKEGDLTYSDGVSKQRREIVQTLFQQFAKLKCSEALETVHCTGVKPSNINMIYKILAVPTSMDYRLGYCSSEQHDNKTCKLSEIKYFKAGPMKEKL